MRNLTDNSLGNSDFYIDNNGGTLAHYTALITVGSTIISAYTILTFVTLKILSKKVRALSES